MKRQVIYRYLGTNGIIESPVHLEDTYFVRVIRLSADKGKILTNGIEKLKNVSTNEEEEKTWKEIIDKGQE